MYGAIIGDIVGSKYEWGGIKRKDFPLISKGCRFTDDSCMTVANSRALLRCLRAELPYKPVLVEEMQRIGRLYWDRGFGGKFYRWLFSDDPKPYNSYGNGSAMRVSPCGLIAVTLEEAISLARASAEVTHNHPEGIKGAEATAAAVFLAKNRHTKEEIAGYIRDRYYPLSKTLDQLRPSYSFDVTCQGSVPEAITAFLESDDYEDAIRNAVSLGGDSDTQAAICGGIGWSFYRFHSPESEETNLKAGRIWPAFCESIANRIDSLLPDDFRSTIEEYDIVCAERAKEFADTGRCRQIILE
ncbi:MAG: ADP-ribosylglycohydrolase family protein [Acidaminococcaceae bacterium]|nr:ADP-ribosylglycohydrolase family protein [Acidaminococcaceae bacterium]